MSPDVRRGLPRRGVGEMYWALPRCGLCPNMGQNPKKNTRKARQAVPHVRRRSRELSSSTLWTKLGLRTDHDFFFKL